MIMIMIIIMIIIIIIINYLFYNKIVPGYDKITIIMLKKLPIKGLVLKTTLLNLLLRFSHFPIK